MIDNNRITKRYSSLDYKIRKFWLWFKEVNMLNILFLRNISVYFAGKKGFLMKNIFVQIVRN